MSEFKFVQWGKGVPNDYQRLNAMMLNDQYLKDKVDLAPRGILVWKTINAITINPTGDVDSLAGLTNIGFDVDYGRAVSFYFNPGESLTYSSACEFRIRFIIDGVTTPSCGGGGFPVAGAAFTPAASGQAPGFYMYPSALSAGSHAVTVAIQANVANDSIVLGNDGICTLVVRDEGPFVDPS